MKRGSVALFVAEPPAQYLVVPPLVVDCSVLSAAIFEEEAKGQKYNWVEIAARAGRPLQAQRL